MYELTKKTYIKNPTAPMGPEFRYIGVITKKRNMIGSHQRKKRHISDKEGWTTVATDIFTFTSLKNLEEEYPHLLSKEHEYVLHVVARTHESFLPLLLETVKKVAPVQPPVSKWTKEDAMVMYHKLNKIQAYSVYLHKSYMVKPGQYQFRANLVTSTELLNLLRVGARYSSHNAHRLSVRVADDYDPLSGASLVPNHRLKEFHGKLVTLTEQISQDWRTVVVDEQVMFTPTQRLLDEVIAARSNSPHPQL